MKGLAQVLEDALAVAAAGAFCVVLEGVPAGLAQEITAQLDIPTIGIGAGPNCDGQVLVCNDLLGMDLSFKPKFVKRYATLQHTIVDAVSEYAKEVRSGSFPGPEHCFTRKDLEELQKCTDAGRHQRRGAIHVGSLL